VTGPGAAPTNDDDALMQQMPGPVQQLGTWGHADRGNPSGYQQTSLGREFFNLHYSTIGRLSERALEMVTATGRNRAGYAPMEFFAECYAEYYADPASAEDRSRRGGLLPGWIKQWFDAHVADQPPRAPQQARQQPQQPRGAR
jgi:hypothetical protein